MLVYVLECICVCVLVYLYVLVHLFLGAFMCGGSIIYVESAVTTCLLAKPFFSLSKLSCTVEPLYNGHW